VSSEGHRSNAVAFVFPEEQWQAEQRALTRSDDHTR
jgi:hypothetical protein